jgi:hypothetical protein
MGLLCFVLDTAWSAVRKIVNFWHDGVERMIPNLYDLDIWLPFILYQ